MTKGEQQLSMVYIDDVTDALIHAHAILKTYQAPKHQHYYVYGELLTLRSIVEEYVLENSLKISIDWGKFRIEKLRLCGPT
ncbi:MAG: hypothetical protein IPM97_04650 [Bdellovibrionaceae bacterium]|nr:hypothetical protein [Pseudobdellovibrionaceae bacterium]